MSISEVLKTDEKLLNKCVEVCIKNQFDNLILLGDLNEPRIKLSDIFVIIEKEGKVDAVFTIFYGFLYPAIVIDIDCAPNNTKIIFDFIKKEITTRFALINFNLPVEFIKNTSV